MTHSILDMSETLGGYLRCIIIIAAKLWQHRLRLYLLGR